MPAATNSTFPAICRLAVGVLLVALVMHTWFVMGLVVPVTVAGSSMAPTLRGPGERYRCAACQQDFAIGIDQLGAVDAICPKCGGWSELDSRGVVAGDRLLVDRTAFLLRKPLRWELAVFYSPVPGGDLCIKRIGGLPGERIAIRDGKVFVDGKPVASPSGLSFELRYQDDPGLHDGRQLGPTEYFMLGDNSAVSDDSRSWPGGPGLDEKRLVGRPIGVR